MHRGGGGMGLMRRSGQLWANPRSPMRWLASAVAVFVCLLGGTAAAASPPEVSHFDGTITFDPQVITDQPCLEGTEFLLISSQTFHGTTVASADGFFHVTFSQEFFGTLTPVNGQGPTYVEAPNTNVTTFTTGIGAAGDQTVMTNVINDRFIG